MWKKNRKIWTVVVLAMSISLLAGDSKHPDTSGWQPLFKEDLSNAITPKGNIWTITKGELTASKDQCIWTKKDYENFVLDLEFKSGPAANSGVIVYVSDYKRWVPNSVEIQILDDAHPKWKNVAPNWKCGAIFGHTSPKTKVRRSASGIVTPSPVRALR
jgi:hypothetical protein